MTSTATRPDIASKVRTRRTRAGSRGRRGKPPRHSWIRWAVLGVLAVVLVAAAVWVWWLASGLLSASRQVQDEAAVAQNELQAFRDTLKAGDEAQAKAHLAAGKAALGRARHAAAADQVRIAKNLPYVGSTVSDLDHLLNAAGIMTRSGSDALVVYQKFSGDDSELFDNGTFSIPAIKEAGTSVEAIMASMTRAEHELDAVTGKGPKGDQALEKKRSALKQIASLRAEVQPLIPVLDAMPSAVGADGKRKYLVAVMNPAEMRASGGAPLSLMFVQFKDGKMSIPLQGTTSTITRGSPEGLLGDSPELVWPRLKGDPFQPPVGDPQRFVNAGFNPDFPVAAEQMRRATPVFFGQKTDGVIALDLVAVAKLLNVTGPIPSDRYGSLTADNLVQKLLVQAYKTQGTDVIARQQENDRLLSVMMTNLVSGGGLLGKARAIGEAVPARHLQMYFRDHRLQQLVLKKGLGGAVPAPKYGNLSAVFTQNGNGSKVDIFQKRDVSEVVRLHQDGSATVTRTVTIDNATPKYVGVGPDPERGYLTRWATNSVINLMPRGAKILKTPTVNLPTTVGEGTDQAGRRFAKAAVLMQPDQKMSLTWTYTVPHAAIKHGDAWRLLDYVAPQGVLIPPQLHLTVVAPKGWTAQAVQPAQGWSADGGRATITVGMDQVRVLKVQVAPQG